MTIARIRPPGGWTDGSTVSGAEFEHFDSQLAEAVHGEGGTYVLSQPLIFNGQPVTFGADIFVGDDLIVGADAVIDGFLDVGTTLDVGSTLTVGADLLVMDDAVITENATIGGILEVTGSITSGGDIIVGDDLVVSFDAVVNGNLTADGDFTASGVTTLIGDLVAHDDYTLGDAGSNGQLHGAIELHGIVSLQGSSTIKARTVIGADFDTSYSPLATTHVYVDALSLSAERNYTINDTNAANGMRIEFTSHSTGHQVNILRPGGANIGTVKAATGFFRSCVVERIGGTWQKLYGVPNDA